jgi:diguanylate cyclase (GGDEF)-like protein
MLRAWFCACADFGPGLRLLLSVWLLLCAPGALAEVRLQYLGNGDASADPVLMTPQPPPAGLKSGQLADPGGGGWWRVELPAAGAVPAELPRVLYFAPAAAGVRITLLLPGQSTPILRQRFRHQGPEWGLPTELPTLLPAAGSQPLVLHVRVEDLRVLRQFELRVVPLEDYLQRSTRHKLYITVATTALLTLAAMAFVLARTLANTNYHLVGAMACSLAAYVLVMSGSLAQTRMWMPFSDYGVLSHRLTTVLAVILSQVFIIRFLELTQRGRPGATILQVLSGLQLLTFAVSVSTPLEPSVTAATASNLLILIGIPVILYEALIAGRAGMPTGRYVLWAWGPALALLLLWVLALEGVLRPGQFDLAGLVYCGLALQVGVLLFGVGSDSARIRRERDHAVEAAERDPLTGALNRRALQQQLDALLRQGRAGARGLTVGFVDLDHFKRINDSHGHAAGDDCLRELVARVQPRLAPGDVFARYGGEEFVLVLPRRSPVQVRAWAEALRAEIADRPFLGQGEPIAVTASIGLARWSEGDSAHRLLDQADRALYRAKQAGRNRVIGPD